MGTSDVKLHKERECSILINCRMNGTILASRGMKSGDPLTPFLFMLVVDILSRPVSTSVVKGCMEGFLVGKKRFHLLHLHLAEGPFLLFQGG